MFGAKKEEMMARSMAKVTSIAVLFLGSIGTLATGPWIENFWVRGAIVMGFTFVTIIYIWKGDEKIFKKVMKSVSSVDDETKKILGDWMISITFGEGENKKVRIGQLKLESSITGVKIKGYRLLDQESDEQTMESWHADDVEIRNFQNKTIILYLYRTKNSSDENSLDKVGLVVATRDNGSNAFVGKFDDLSLDNNGAEKRSGTVKLFKQE
ncbi:hypothetical protein [Neptuniibacter sp. QD57_21]|uniref:hypothetical protein n=1 Tax=Neptuniibacter sp. QD57_21 TaxID=3398213 RepID=UPI0039F4DDD5